MIGKLLFEFAKGDAIGNIVGLGFEYGSALIPVKRVHSTNKILCFLHPKPAYPNHILLVPKKKIRDHFVLLHQDNLSYFTEIWFAVQQIAEKKGWIDQGGYVLCSNGGPRQEVKQLHFHLFNKKLIVNGYDGVPPHTIIEQNDHVKIFHHPDPSNEIHLLVTPSEDTANQLIRSNEKDIRQVLGKMLEVLPRLNDEFDLVRRGYTIVFQVDPTFPNMQQHLTLHVIAGKRK